MSPHFVSRRQQKIWEKQQRENAEKKASHANQSAFRYAERVFKSNIFTPEFKEIVDFSNIDNNTQETKDNLIKVKLSNDLRQLSAAFGTPSDSPQVYAIVMKNIPGLIVIPNPFTPKAQRTLVKHCLTDCAKPPHTSNLDGHYHTPLQGIWPLYKREQEGNLKPSDHGYYIPIKTIECQDQGIYTENADDDEAASTVSSMYSSIGKSAHIQSPTQLLKKQRWITLGYQYHWGSKKYNLDNLIPIPGLISDLMKAVAIATDDIGCDEAIVKWKNEYKGRDFKPEAGIINYYQLQSTLMGHVDQSELNMDAPLISLSLGHSCIYLIGGLTKDTKPIPLRLNSGDIIVMTKICRKAYHGVPKIIKGSLPDYMAHCDDPKWPLYAKYMSTTRINLNIRQVFPNEP